ncbi:MAG: UDP binding domain-containing protein [Rhodospirillales bacterium]
MPFYPGPGLGGHCIPIDPFYLSWKAQIAGYPTRFIELAGEINAAMPNYVIGILTQALQERFGTFLQHAKILLIGIAYKKNVDDVRETPAFPLIELLERRGAAVDFYDPYVPEIPKTREHAALAGRTSVQWEPARFGDYDAALICTDHDCIDFEALVAACRLVVDARNATRNATAGRDKIVPA